MIGSLVTRGATMVFGYIYPAYECFKTVEQRRPNLDLLRFWCQYWIIIALVTVIERIADTFISWLPMYCEAKLAFILYLQYPRTKGTTYIYSTFLRPYLMSHESEIEQHLNELRTRAIDCVALYWQRGAAIIQVKFFEILQYVAAQANRPAPQPAPAPAPQVPPPPPSQQPPAPPPPSAPVYNAQPQGVQGVQGFFPPQLQAPVAGFEASAPPVAPNPVYQAPPPPPPVLPVFDAPAAAPTGGAAPYRQGLYPPIHGYPNETQLRNLIRDRIDLEEEITEEVIPINNNINTPGEPPATSSARYMTRSRQRTTSTSSSTTRGSSGW